MREALTGQHVAQLALEMQNRDEAQTRVHTLEEKLAHTHKEHNQLNKTHTEKVSDNIFHCVRLCCFRGVKEVFKEEEEEEEREEKEKEEEEEKEEETELTSSLILTHTYFPDFQLDSAT